MSLKAIELQIALPRTQEAGKIHEQLQQRGQLQNDLASLELQQEDKRKRTSVTRKNQKEKLQLEQHNHSSQGNYLERNNDKSLQNDTLSAPHPFKGNFVDFSG